MPPTVAQDIGSLIAGLAVGFLEQYEGSGVPNLTPEDKHAIGRELVNDRPFQFDLQGNPICLCSPEWKQLPENVGKRWITVRAYEHSSRMGPRSARNTEYTFGLSARLNSYQELQHTTNPFMAYNGTLFSKNVAARCEIPAGIRHEVFESFLAAKVVDLHGLWQWPIGRAHDWNGL